MKYFGILIITLLAALLQAPQTASSVEPAAEPASLEGIVLRANSEPPMALARARVVLNLNRGINNSITLTVPTDSAGRFMITNIPPGSYNLMATRDGYVRASKPLVLEPRQAI
jgi:hypothetical protein